MKEMQSKDSSHDEDFGFQGICMCRISRKGVRFLAFGLHRCPDGDSLQSTENHNIRPEAEALSSTLEPFTYLSCKDGCQSGFECQFCHICPPGEIGRKGSFLSSVLSRTPAKGLQRASARFLYRILDTLSAAGFSLSTPCSVLLTQHVPCVCLPRLQPGARSCQYN